MTALTLPYSVAEATQQVRTIINEPSPAFFEDEEIENWLVEGVIDVSTHGVAYEKSDNITLAATTLEYTDLVTGGADAIANIVKIYGAIYNNGSNGYVGLQQIHPRQITHLSHSDAGDPKYFWHFASKIGIFPLTTAAIVSGGGKVQLFFSEITDDITNLPLCYQQLPIFFAAAKAKMKDNKFQAANLLMSQYFNMLAFQRTDLYMRPVDSKDMFKTPDRTKILT